MIIKKWGDLLIARDEGKEFEFYCDLDLDWKVGSLDGCTFKYLNEMMGRGWLSTKPETIGNLYEYRSKTGQVIWSEDQLATIFHTSEDMDNIYFRVTDRVIRNGVIEESDNE